MTGLSCRRHAVTQGFDHTAGAMLAMLERKYTAHHMERNEQQWPRFAAALEKLGLTTLDGVRSFQGTLVKNHKGSRDIFRIPVTDTDGSPVTLYLKRIWKSYKKDGLLSLLQHGRVWSVSRREWENSKALQAAGVNTAPLLALGEECGLLWEKFSFILTVEAPGTQTACTFLQNCTDPVQRRRVFDALAREIRKLHDAGLASPDLFARHVFIDQTTEPPRFCLIDMARLNRRRSLSDVLRARDLAALSVTAPLRHVSTRERLRFLKLYAGKNAATLLPLVVARMKYLLRRRKFHDFSKPARDKNSAPDARLPHRRGTTETPTTSPHLQP